MNKIIIAAIASAALATYFIMRRRSNSQSVALQPARNHRSNSDKHLTNVFQKAKKQVL